MVSCVHPGKKCLVSFGSGVFCLVQFVCLFDFMYIHHLKIIFTWVRLGHMKNALVGVVYIAIIKHPQVHSSYDQVLPL